MQKYIKLINNIKLYKNIVKNYTFQKKYNFYLDIKNNFLVIQGKFGIYKMILPSYFFFKIEENNSLYLKFINKQSYLAFLKHFFLCYNRLYLLYFIRLKIKGIRLSY